MEVVLQEVVVVEELEGTAGLPSVAFSRLLGEQRLVPVVQVHDDAGDVAGQAAGSHLQLLAVEPLELQGEGQQGGQAGLSAQRSPCHPQSRGRGWHLRLLPRPG